jgi:hypothetical protein
MHAPVDEQRRGYHEEQAESDSKDEHAVAMAVEFGGPLRDGFWRNGSTTGGTEASAVKRLSAVATKLHFCYPFLVSISVIDVYYLRILRTQGI